MQTTFITKFPYNLFAKEVRAGRRAAVETAVREMEDLGYWGFSHADHFMTQANTKEMGREGQRFGDILTFMTWMAAITTRAKIIPRVMILPYRNPLLTAHALVTLDVLSEGRLIAGMGAGHEPREFEVLGVPMRERGARTDEYIRVIRSLWTEQSVNFEARFGKYVDASINERPVQKPHPPIWVGGQSKAALRRAVELGDGWVPNSYVRPWDPPPGTPVKPATPHDLPTNITLTEFREGLEWAAVRRRELGKPPLQVSLGTGTSLVLEDRPGQPPRKADKFYEQGSYEEFREKMEVCFAMGVTSFTANFEADTLDAYMAKARAFAAKIVRA